MPCLSSHFHLLKEVVIRGDSNEAGPSYIPDWSICYWTGVDTTLHVCCSEEVLTEFETRGFSWFWESLLLLENTFYFLLCSLFLTWVKWLASTRRQWVYTLMPITYSCVSITNYLYDHACITRTNMNINSSFKKFPLIKILATVAPYNLSGSTPDRVSWFIIKMRYLVKTLMKNRPRMLTVEEGRSGVFSKNWW